MPTRTQKRCTSKTYKKFSLQVKANRKPANFSRFLALKYFTNLSNIRNIILCEVPLSSRPRPPP